MSTEARGEDAGLGAVLGALVGDAAGAVLEFLGRPPTRDEVERALGMPGGGTWRVAPGQITDDGELTLCLARALAGRETFDLDLVAWWYHRWYQSPPFDMGATTSAGLSAWRGDSGEPTAGMARAMQAAARARSMGSKANGSLMRASPLGPWGRDLSDDALAEVARADSSLTHPNASCGDAVAAYAIAIASLVRAPGDRGAAMARSGAWIARAACEEVRGWFALAEADDDVAYWPQAGFVKIAFVHAFRHLRRGSGFVAALSETLLGGGDTDTNACIVGGLIGAAVGAAAIPEAMRAAVLTCDHGSGRRRPAFLHPREVPHLVSDLLGRARPSSR